MMLTTTTAAPCSRSSQRSAMAVSEAFLQSRHCRIACKGFLTLACCLVHLGPQQPLCVCVCVCVRARARLLTAASASADTGGDLVTLEPNGTRLVHRLQKGDSACLVSHKYHSISPVLSGERHSLVVELWQGGIAGLGRS